jgi:hypothetical protein
VTTTCWWFACAIVTVTQNAQAKGLARKGLIVIAGLSRKGWTASYRDYQATWLDPRYLISFTQACFAF